MSEATENHTISNIGAGVAKAVIPFANKGSKTIQNILFYYARVHEDNL